MPIHFGWQRGLTLLLPLFPKPACLALSTMKNEDRELGEQTVKFWAWWKGDPERVKCTLEQAIGAYCSTFPGRLHSLLVELLEHTR